MDKNILNAALAYIGKRFDALEVLLKSSKSEIKVDLGDASELLLEVSGSLNRLVAQMMTKDTKENAGLASMTKIPDGLKSMLRELEAHSQYLSSLAIDSKRDGTATLKAELAAVVEAIKKITIDVPDIEMPELSELASSLDMILSALETVDLKTTEAILGRIEKAVLANKINFPRSFMLDDTQFRELRTLLAGSGGGTGGLVGGGAPPTPAAGIIRDGRKAIAVTDTAIALGTDTCEQLFVTAFTSNSAEIVIGGSTVLYDNAGSGAARTGKIMFPGDSITMNVRSLAKVFINGISGDGVTFTYTKI